MRSSLDWAPLNPLISAHPSENHQRFFCPSTTLTLLFSLVALFKPRIFVTRHSNFESRVGSQSLTEPLSDYNHWCLKPRLVVPHF